MDTELFKNPLAALFIASIITAIAKFIDAKVNKEEVQPMQWSKSIIFVGVLVAGFVYMGQMTYNQQMMTEPF